MAEYVKNRVKITGNSTDLNLLAAWVSSETSQFDFEKICQMPKSLMIRIDIVSVLSQKLYKAVMKHKVSQDPKDKKAADEAQEKLFEAIATGLVARLYNDVLQMQMKISLEFFQGDNAQQNFLIALEKASASVEALKQTVLPITVLEKLSETTIVPFQQIDYLFDGEASPKTIEDAFWLGCAMSINDLKYETSNWQDWRLEKWGTPKNAIDAKVEFLDSESLQIEFVSEFDFPKPIFKTVCKPFWFLQFEGWYSDENIESCSHEHWVCDSKSEDIEYLGDLSDEELHEMLWGETEATDV